LPHNHHCREANDAFEARKQQAEALADVTFDEKIFINPAGFSSL